jgi:hypothetical protein
MTKATIQWSSGITLTLEANSDDGIALTEKVAVELEEMLKAACAGLGYSQVTVEKAFTEE